MARFYGAIGYAETKETAKNSGVWIDEITEFPYYGDVIRNYTNFSAQEKINEDLTLGNAISVVADQYAIDHFFNIKYVSWMGALWTVKKVEVKPPRLELSLGSVYNGPTPKPTEPSD